MEMSAEDYCSKALYLNTAQSAEGRRCEMGKRSDYKKADGIADWDLDAGCRRIIDQSTPGRRRLRKRLKRIARKRLSGGWKDGRNGD